MYLPLYFDPKKLTCLIIGGGTVAARKASVLITAGCRLTVIAPELDDSIRAAVASGRAAWKQRTFQPGDCSGFRLVVAATPDEAVNRAVAAEAMQVGIPVNVVDAPQLCSVVFGASWQDGPLTVSVSTGGRAPFMASEVRNRIAEDAVGMGQWIEAAGRFREAVREGVRSTEDRSKLYQVFAARARSESPEDLPDCRSLEEWLQWLGVPRPSP